MASEDAAKKPQRAQIPIVCPGHTRPLTELQFCQVPDENNRTLLISACHDRLPMVRDGTSGDWIGTFSGHKGAVWSCRVDPTANICATASGDFSVRLWDAITGKVLWEWKHSHIVKTCDFSPSSRYLASGGHEGILRIYDLQDLTKHPKPSPCTPREIKDAGQAKPITISKCLWLSETLILVGCADGRLRVWSTESSAQPLLVVDTQSNAEVRDLELCGSTLIVASGKAVYFYEWKANQLTFQKTFPMPIHFKDEGGASLHPSGTKFVAGGSDLWVRVFDASSGAELECLKGHHGPIRCLRYSPSGDIYASGSEDGTIRLWKTNPEVE